MRSLLLSACLAASSLALLAPTCHADTLDFSSGTLKNNTDGSFKTYKQSSYTVKDRSTDNFVFSDGAIYGGYSEALGTPDSSWNSATVYLLSTDPAFLLDQFDVYYAGKYKVTWNLYAFSDTSGNALTNANMIDTGTIGKGSIAQWYTVDLASYEVPYAYEYAIQLTISNNATGSKALFGLDNIEVSPTPEPGSLVLMGTGLLGVGAAFRRRRTA